MVVAGARAGRGRRPLAGRLDVPAGQPLRRRGLRVFRGDLSEAGLREDFLQPFADFMARGGGLPALYTVLTAGAAGVLTRASGVANTVQGVLLGLVSAVGIQLIGRAFGPFSAWELVVYPLLGVAGGWLGVALSRGAVERQEALYKATGALYAVDAPRDVAAAVGGNLPWSVDATRGVRGRGRSGAR